MFCEHCGAPLEPGARFCTACGTPLDVPEPAAPSEGNDGLSVPAEDPAQWEVPVGQPTRSSADVLDATQVIASPVPSAPGLADLGQTLPGPGAVAPLDPRQASAVPRQASTVSPQTSAVPPQATAPYRSGPTAPPPRTGLNPGIVAAVIAALVGVVAVLWLQPWASPAGTSGDQASSEAKAEQTAPLSSPEAEAEPEAAESDVQEVTKDVPGSTGAWTYFYKSGAAAPVVSQETVIVFFDQKDEPLESFTLKVTDASGEARSFTVEGATGVSLAALDVSQPGSYSLQVSDPDGIGKDLAYPAVPVTLGATADQNRRLLVASDPSDPVSAEAPATVTEARPAADDYLLPDSATRTYSQSELESLTSYDLFLARNEIFARHGRRFQRAELQDYFGSKSWYVPLYDGDEFDALDLLSSVEKKNAETMLKIEKERNSPYLS